MARDDFTQKQFQIAETVLDCFYGSLKERIGEGECVSMHALDEAYRKVKEMWPSLLPLYEKNCRECMELAGQKFVPDVRRKDHFTRLILSKLSVYHPRRDKTYGKKSFVQMMTPGLRQHLHGVYSQTEYLAMNEQALAVFSLAKTDVDSTFWEIAEENAEILHQADKIIMHYMLRFRPFNFHKENFVSTMRQSIDLPGVAFTDSDFVDLFDCLFGNYFVYMSDHKRMTMLNMQFGCDSSDHLLSIYNAYQRLQQGRRQHSRHQAVVSAGTQLWL